MTYHKYSIIPRTLFMLCLYILFPLTVFAAGMPDIGLISPLRLYRETGKWIILDARPPDQYKKGHIPESMPFCWEQHTRTDPAGVRYRMPLPEKTARLFEDMDIGNQDAIAVYGDADTSWGGEGWVCWLLSYLGHSGAVRLVKGGLKAWQAAGLSTSSGTYQSKNRVTARKKYKISMEKCLNISAAELSANMEQYMIVDVRSGIEWGMGHIPGAVWISWKDFYSGPDRTPLSSDALRKLLTSHGYRGKRQVVYYCTGGIRSGFTWLVHGLSGLRNAINFEGGMEEWEKRYK